MRAMMVLRAALSARAQDVRGAPGAVCAFSPAHVPRDILCGRGREAAGERRVCRLGGIGLVIAACYQRA